MKAENTVLPSQYPITLAEAKKQLEIDDADTAHDTYVDALLRAATGQAEQYLHRRLVTQTWKLYLNEFPSCDYITLPFGRLQSVTHLKYTDSDDDQTTFSTDNYSVDTVSEPGQIVLKYEKVWPTVTLANNNALEIQFVCGYYIGSTWATATAYAANTQVMPTTENGLVYQSSGGTSDATEPATWPVTIGSTVADNDITWTCLGIAVPEPIRQAIKIHIADMFEYRETDFFGSSYTKLKTWEALLLPYKLFGGITE
jgi:uncharacterized phiE125 gp8 family phage protein